MLAETTFPPNRPASTPATSPILGAASFAATGAASPLAPATEGKPSATPQSSAASATPRICENPGCGKPAPGNAACCGSTCRKALWRIEHREKRLGNKPTHDTKAGTGSSIKNFLSEKIDAARNRISQAFATNKQEGTLPASGESQSAIVSLAGSAPGSVDRGKAFRKLCVAGVKTVDRAAKGLIRHLAKKKGASKQFIDGELLREVGTAEDVDNFSEALDDYLRSINYVPEKPEQVALLIAAVNFGAGYVGAVKAISDIEPEQKQTKEEKE